MSYCYDTTLSHGVKIERGTQWVPGRLSGLTLIFIRFDLPNPRSILFAIKATLVYAVGTSTQRRSRAASRIESATAWARIPS